MRLSRINPLYQWVRRHKGGVGTTAPGFLAAFLWLARRWRGRRLSAADQRRQSDTQGPEHGASAARSRIAQQVDLAVLLDFGFAQPFEILHDVGPFEVVAGRDQPVLELLAKDQSQEGAEGVAANGLIVFVKDGTGGEQRLTRAKDVLDHPAVAVAQGGLQRGQLHGDPDHVDAIVERVERDAPGIDFEAAAGSGLEETAIAAVAHQALVAAAQCFVETGQDGLAVGGVLLGFGLVEADDVAPAPGFAVGIAAGAVHLLDEQIGGAAPGRFGNAQRHIRGGVSDDAADLFGAAFTHANDVVDIAGLQFGQVGLTDHAAISDDADARDHETVLQALDDRQQRDHIGGVARPQLGTDRPTTRVDHHRQDHLFQVGAVILGMAVLAKALTDFTLEAQRGGIEKDKAQLAEQVVAQGEQLLLDEILGSARTNAASALVGQFVAKPAHRPVELVQIEAGDPVDDQAVPPLLRCAVRAGIEQAMQDSQKHSTFEIELELAFGGQRADHLFATGLPPQSLDR